MEGTYPLLLDGVRAGELTVTAEGGWTVFDVRCEGASGLVRVSVYGAGREGYLGVLAPDGEAMTLRRRLSRSALRDFPPEIEYAGRAAETQTPPEPEEETAGCDAHIAPPEETTETPSEVPPCAPEPEHGQTETPPDETDLYWYATTDGALVSFDGTKNRIALPVGDARIPAGGGGQAETIEGRDYVVFRTKNGQLQT